MAIIVTLPARGPGRSASSDQDVGATILFFTGVRYERDIDPVPEAVQDAGASHESNEPLNARAAV